MRVRRSRRRPRSSSLLALVVVAALPPSRAATAEQGASVAATLHNLSVSGPGEIKAAAETEVCKFCHIPHSAIAATPLWGHALSEVDYAVPDIRRGDRREPSPAPDGSSRLCLSCHDGTVALGQIVGLEEPVEMLTADRLTPERPGFIGTDLTGDHPISFVVSDVHHLVDGDVDMGLAPLDIMRSDPDVKLDAQGKMQCTTCHDPHADQYHVPGQVPRFWVKPTVTEVCLTCHVAR